MTSPSAPIRVLVADDHGVVRDGLRSLLVQEGGFDVVGTAGDGEEAVAVTERLQPDVLLLDLSMPKLDGIGVLARLRAHSARDGVRVILLSAAIPKHVETQALALGARGVILKDTSAKLLFKSIKAVAAGEYWVRREVIGDLVRAIEFGGGHTAPPSRFGLTDRELEITSLVSAGYSSREIAERCGLSAETVKHHVSNIFDKAGVSSRVELARFAVAHGLTGDPDLPR